MNRLLITGASGFVGRHCLPLTTPSQYEVHCVSRRGIEVQAPGVVWHKADLFDAAQSVALVREVQPSHLLHLAWYAEPVKYWSSAENFRWSEASLLLLRSFVECGGKRAVLAGTCAEYDWNFGFCSEETTPIGPATFYGRCKSSLGRIAMDYAEQNGLSLAWARLFFIYGPFEPAGRLVPSVVQGLLRRQPVPCTSGEQIRDYLHVGDVASALTALLASETQGAVNIASGVPIPIRRIVEILADCIGHSELIDWGAVPTPAEQPPVLFGDVRKLRRQTGWTPAISLEEGLRATAQWWREQHPSE